jgi:hypothetical protein
MKSIALPPLTLVWLSLMTATVLTGLLAETESGVRWAIITMLAIGVVKVWLIMWHFMELRAAPVVWRLGLAAWLAVAAAILLSSYMLAVSIG